MAKTSNNAQPVQPLASLQKKYTRIQYFFWILSGAEISILKNCPTDYNRQAGIGFTIFMTTLLAFFSGGYAGYYFGENYLSAVVFGLLWACLIFSIDRSMVVTLKKDPTLPKQDFWPPLISRGLLSILIAFIISIPLELLIFKENIDLHMQSYKLDQTYHVQQAAARNQDLTTKERSLKRDSTYQSQLEANLSVGEPVGDPEYAALKRRENILQTAYANLKSKYNAALSSSSAAYNNVPFADGTDQKDHYSSQWNAYLKKKLQKDIAWKNLKNFNLKSLTDVTQKKENFRQQWIDSLKNEKNNLAKNMRQTNAAIKAGNLNVDSASRQYEDTIRDKKGFVLRFMVLENLAQRYKEVEKEVPVYENENDSKAKVSSDTIRKKIIDYKKVTVPEKNEEGATIFFLLWLIRILFFTIEILPTIAKIATPIGAYDWAVYRREKDFELELQERTSQYLLQKKQLRDLEYQEEQKQVKDRHKVETSLYKELLTDIAAVQNQVAKQKIEEFKNGHLKTVPKVNKLENNFWVQKQSPDKLEYFFRNGSPANNEFIYFEKDEIKKGKWTLAGNELEIRIDSDVIIYVIAELTGDTLKWKEKGTNEIIEFEKVK